MEPSPGILSEMVNSPTTSGTPIGTSALELFTKMAPAKVPLRDESRTRIVEPFRSMVTWLRETR